MAISDFQTFEKRRLIITLGENEAPASWDWEGVVYTRNDDGSDAAPPFTDKRPASDDDVAQHIGQAATDQAAAFARFNSQIADRDATIAQATTALAGANTELTQLRAMVAAVRQTVAIS